jgi:hypothetical protein
MKREELIELLYAALGTPLGVEVETNRPDLLRAKLYAARRGDSALDCLSIHESPSNPSGALFIVNRGNSDGHEPPETHS